LKSCFHSNENEICAISPEKFAFLQLQSLLWSAGFNASQIKTSEYNNNKSSVGFPVADPTAHKRISDLRRQENNHL